MKSVLIMAGQIKRVDFNQNDQVVFLKALVDSNLPKLVLEDV